MTYTETQLEAIRIFGRKDLTEGCIVEAGDFKEVGTYLIRLMDRIYLRTGDFITNRHSTEIKEILGHIPHLEDLFRVAEEKGVMINLSRDSNDGFELFVGMRHFPYNPTIPLLDQPNLSDIISLFR